jgi:hypothetical protein
MEEGLAQRLMGGVEGMKIIFFIVLLAANLYALFSWNVPWIVKTNGVSFKEWVFFGITLAAIIMLSLSLGMEMKE